MTLTVETGAGLANAESYISVAAADARAAAFGNAAWTGDTAAKEAALRRATAFLEQSYRSSWKGQRVTSTQALSWPRYGVCVDGFPVAVDIVPADIANACADLAARALTETLNADQTRAVIREKVGPLETEYDRNSPQATRYNAVVDALSPYLIGSSSMATLVRA